MANGVELATAWVRLVPSVEGIQGAIAKEFGGAGVESESVRSGNKIGDSLLKGIGKVAKVGALAVGGVIAAGVGTALVKGFGRLTALDQANAKLTGLGHSAKTVDMIMDNALASVRGTAFGMDEAASAAAGAVAAGIKPGKDLERTLKGVADAASIAGVDMGSMGAIFNKVAASNKVQMDVINQLHDAGVPALALLADKMGLTVEETAKMASAGKIDFATFRAAMEDGMGGAALESGNTFSGAMDNVMAALGRVGANLLSGLFPQMTDGFKGIIEWLAPFEEGAKDVGKAVGDFVADAAPKLVAVLQDVFTAGSNVLSWVKDNVTWLAPLGAGILAAAAALTVWSAVTKTAAAVQLAFNLVMNANPIMLVITAIAALVAGLVYFFTQTELGQQIWENVTNAIGTAITWLWESVLKPVIDFIGAAWDWLYNTVILPVVTGIMIYIGLWAAVFEWLWQTVLAPIFEAIGAVFDWVWTQVISPIITYIKLGVHAWGMIFDWLYKSAIKPAFDGMATAFDWIWNSVIKPVVDFINTAIDTVGSTVRSVFGGISSFIGSAFKAVLGVVRGPINALIGLINEVIGGINSIRVDIPDWVPLVGGETFGLNIPKIPMLASGGVITAGGSVIVGENGPELLSVPAGAVVDPDLRGAKAAASAADEPLELSESTLDRLADKFARKLEGYSRTDRRGWAI